MEQLEKPGFQPQEFKNKDVQEELIKAAKYNTKAAVEASGSSTLTPPRVSLGATCLATGAMMEVPLLHGGLLPEPLLAGSAVLDVLQHVAQHGPLPALVIPRPLHPLVHFGTWSGGGDEGKNKKKLSPGFPFACSGSTEVADSH